MTRSHDALETLGDGVHLDVQKLIDSRLLVQANSGGGKSYVVRKICEITYGHAQIIVLDPDGEFHTLREKFDFALAGPEGECPATVETAALTARTLLELGTVANRRYEKALRDECADCPNPVGVNKYTGLPTRLCSACLRKDRDRAAKTAAKAGHS